MHHDAELGYLVPPAAPARSSRSTPPALGRVVTNTRPAEGHQPTEDATDVDGIIRALTINPASPSNGQGDAEEDLFTAAVTRLDCVDRAMRAMRESGGQPSRPYFVGPSPRPPANNETDSQKRTRTYLDCTHFLGPTEVANYFGPPSAEQIASLAEVGFRHTTLLRGGFRNGVLVADIGLDIITVRQTTLSGVFDCYGNACSYYARQPFAHEVGRRPQWLFFYGKPLEHSGGKSWDAQMGKLPRGERIPSPRELVYAAALYNLHTGDTLIPEGISVRTNSLDENGDRINIGTKDGRITISASPERQRGDDQLMIMTVREPDLSS